MIKNITNKVNGHFECTVTKEQNEEVKIFYPIEVKGIFKS